MRIVLLAALFAVGCGGGTGNVSGTVTYRGKLLPTGIITFLDGRNQVLASSPIREGKYAAFDVPAGPVKIIVSTPPAASQRRRARQLPKIIKSESLGKGSIGRRSTVAAETVPAQYADPDQSGLTFTVRAGEQEHPVDLK